MKKLTLACLAFCLTLPLSFCYADSAELTQFLKSNKISPKDSKQFKESATAAASSYKQNLRKLGPDDALPKPVDDTLNRAGQMIRTYHLGGDQALTLLQTILIEVNPKVRAAAPAMTDLEEMMRQHNVPGPQLYDFLEPGIKQNIVLRLRGQKPPPPGLIQLQQAAAFADRYGLPTRELVAKLQEMRSALEGAEDSP